MSRAAHAARLVFFLTAAATHAGEGSVSLEQLHPRRQEVEGRYRDVVKKVAVSTRAVQEATAATRQCRDARVRVLFDGTLHRVETARRQLETGRRDTQVLRASLERARQGLESQRREQLKAGQRTTARDTEYATAMDRSYLVPLETQVVKLVDGYAAGLADYAQVLDRYARFCGQPGPAASRTAFLEELRPAVDALESRAQAFAVAAAQARPLPAVAAR